MWKPLEVAANPARYFRKYGFRGLLDRTVNYPLRPIRRRLDQKAALAEARSYEAALARARSTDHPLPKILFYPDCPAPSSAIFKMCASMGFEMVSDPMSDVRLAVMWKDATLVDAAPVEGIKTLNKDCRDISKEAVARAFEAVFGYSFHVDPSTHSGPVVEKSDTNGLHDGAIVQSPVAPVPGRVYQRVIDNQVGNGFVMDIRTPVIGDVIPFVYLKYRRIYDRFSNSNTRVARRPTSEMFSRDEVEKILAFSRNMGLDYGELDILRDRGDGRIYIVDVNKTPAGPPNHLDREEGRRAMRELGEAFASRFLTSPGSCACRP